MQQRDGSDNSYPRGNTEQKEWMPVPTKNLPDARPTHSHKLHITTGKKQAMLHALYAAFLTHGVKKLVGISAVSVLIAAKLHPQRGGDTKSRKEHLLAEEDTACQSSWIALWEHHSAVPAQGVWPPAQR